MKIHTKTLLAALTTTAVIAGNSTHAATIIIDDFESGSGNWTTSAGSYITTHDFGSGVVGAAAIDTTKNGTPLTLTNPLFLSSLGATTINIDFVGEWGRTGQATRFFFVEYSSNGGTNWTSLDQIDSREVPASGGYDVSGANITDAFLFRFRPKDDGGNNDDVFYIDEVTITHDGVPEPGSLALLAAGGLLIGARRRRA